MNETCNIMENIYSQATARTHLDKPVSDGFPINRGVIQGGPLHLSYSLLLWKKSLRRDQLEGESLKKLKVCQ